MVLKERTDADRATDGRPHPLGVITEEPEGHAEIVYGVWGRESSPQQVLDTVESSLVHAPIVGRGTPLDTVST